MREYTQALGLPALAALLRTSEELEVDEEGKNVRRKREVEEPKGQWERSVYAVRYFVHYLPAFSGESSSRVASAQRFGGKMRC